MELNEKIAALESENAALRAKLSKSEGARQTAQIYLDDAKEHCRNEVQNLRHKLSGYINKVANLEQKLEQSEKRLGLFLEGDTCLIYSGIDKKWFVHYEDELEIYSIGSGLTKIEAIDAAIAKEKENA